MLDVINAAVWGFATGFTMFAAGLAWERRERVRHERPHPGGGVSDTREFSVLELRRKWIVAVFAGVMAFLLAVVAYSAY